jgi:hypothetical protein
MKMKDILREGRKEWERRATLRRKGRDIGGINKELKGQLTALGQKAWEANIDLAGHEELKSSLTAIHKHLDQLKAQTEELENQKIRVDEKKNQEMERQRAARSEKETKKKDIDSRLNLENHHLKAAQLEEQHAAVRLTAISAEKDYLDKKNLDPAVPEAEKGAIRLKMESLEAEVQALQAKSPIKAEEIKLQTEKVALIQAEANEWQKQIDALNEEQKKVEGELNKTLAGLDKELKVRGTEFQDAEKQQKTHFLQLGEKLAAANLPDAAVAGEMAALRDKEKALADVRADIHHLESQKTEAGTSALNKLIMILVSGAALIVATIIILIVLL